MRWSALDVYGKCAFCSREGYGDITQLRNWHVCYSDVCRNTAEYHTERVYACLVDCPETRRDTRTWVLNRMAEGTPV